MTKLTDLLGEQLLEHKTNAGVTKDVFMSTNQLNGKVVALYFSGHWCGPSQQFTSTLAAHYKSVYDEIKDKLEIVFISSDRTQSEFDGYYREMSWKALSYSDRTRANAIQTKYSVTSIPRLVVLLPSCEVLTTTGVEEVRKSGADSFRQWSKHSLLTNNSSSTTIQQPMAFSSSKTMSSISSSSRSSSSWSSGSYSYSYTSSSGQSSTRAVSLPTDAFDRFLDFKPQRAISQNGFMKVSEVIMMGSNSSDEDITEAFNILDADGSGQLDVSELAKIIPAILPGTTLETLGQLIHRYDKNFDNQLNLKEFTSLIKGGLGRDLVFRDLVMIEYHT